MKRSILQLRSLHSHVHPDPVERSTRLRGTWFGVQIACQPTMAETRIMAAYGHGAGPYHGSYGDATHTMAAIAEYEYDEEPVVVQRRVYSGYGEPIVRRRVVNHRGATSEHEGSAQRPSNFRMDPWNAFATAANQHSRGAAAASIPGRSISRLR